MYFIFWNKEIKNKVSLFARNSHQNLINYYKYNVFEFFVASTSLHLVNIKLTLYEDQEGELKD